MKILIAGDYCPQDRISEMVEKADYSFFNEIKPIIESHDLSVVNFECPVVNPEDLPIEKSGPNLKAIPNAVNAIKYAGFNVATTANNHILDYGENALNKTLKLLNDSGIMTVGSGRNLQEASSPLNIEKDGEKLSIINCCEHEFSIATHERGGAFPIDIVDVTHKIMEAKGKGSKVLVITHGGHEMCQLPPIDMKKRNRFFIEMGADAVVNHHQHVFSGYEVYNGKPIFYGLGNLCFDKKGYRNSPWNYGYMASIDFNDLSFEIIPYEQCSNNSGCTIIKISDIAEEFDKLNAIIKDDMKLSENLNNYYQSVRNHIENDIQPYSNRYLLALKRRNILTSVWKRRSLLRLRNQVSCESHRAKLLWYFNS